MSGARLHDGRSVAGRTPHAGIAHAPVPWIRGRKAFVMYLAHGERILHVGCADNLSYEEGLAGGTHLHQALEATEEHVLGIDVDEEAVARLRERGLRTVHAVDLRSEDGRLLVERFAPTVILLPEVIEHIENPGEFLRLLAGMARGPGARLVLTAPNAFSARVRHLSHARSEQVNPDHRFYFSRATLGLLLEDTGWHATRWWGYAASPRIPRRASRWEDEDWLRFRARLRERFPALDPADKPWKGGRRYVPSLVKRIHHRLVHDRARYRSPIEYEGLVVEAVPA